MKIADYHHFALKIDGKSRILKIFPISQPWLRNFRCLPQVMCEPTGIRCEDAQLNAGEEDQSWCKTVFLVCGYYAFEIVQIVDAKYVDAPCRTIF